MTVSQLRRPRSFDDVHANEVLLAERMDRIVEAQLASSQQYGLIMAAIAQLEKAVEKQQLGPMRERESSYHDWDAELAEMDRILKTRVKDPRDRMNSERAKAIAREAVAVAKGEEAQLALGEQKRRAAEIRTHVIAGVLVGVVMLIIGLMVGWLTKR